MGAYFLHFIVYAMAMIGIIFLAVFTHNLTCSKKFKTEHSTLSVTESMKLTPKKTLYVVKAGDEKFLIASDFDSTTLISKLGCNENIETSIKPQREDKSTTLPSFDGLKSMNEFIMQFDNKKTTKQPIMRELARKLQNC